MTKNTPSSGTPGDAPDRDPFTGHVVDRRRFLAQAGALGALGAAFLTLGNGAEAMVHRLASISSVPGGGAARPIHMVCLGDSVMWGQGLRDDQKFQTRLERWIETAHPERRQVLRWNFAHSGATIGSLRGLPSARSGPGQMSAAAFSHAARRGNERNAAEWSADIPELEPRVLRRRGEGDDAPVTPASSGGSPNHGRPSEPSYGDLLGGEIPRTYPTLWRQLDIALETLRTGSDPRAPKGAKLAPVDPVDVDLVLVDGGANDIGFLDTILDADRSAQQTYDYVRGIVEPRMRAYLPHLLTSFPNATVVMTTVYRGISPQSTPAALTPFIVALGGIVTGAAGLLVGGSLAAHHMPGLVARNDAMERAIADSYHAIVKGLDQKYQPDRILIVSPDFAPENGYGAPRSYLWHVEQADPVEGMRIRECDSLLGQWFSDAGSVFLTGNSPQRADTPLWLICRDASMFHPNAAGAARYFEKIRDALVAAQPAFMRGQPKLRLQVQGATQGDTKSVTVNAFDATTGKPVSGTVSIGGATGTTGTAVAYKANACGVAAAAPAEVPNAKGAVRRLPVRGGAAAAAAAKPLPCGGKVVVSGYAEATFTY